MFVCDVTYSYAKHDSFTRTNNVFCHDRQTRFGFRFCGLGFLCVTWLIRSCETTPLHHQQIMCSVTIVRHGCLHMRHVTCKWVTSRMAGYHMYSYGFSHTSHVTYGWVTSNMNDLRHIWMSHIDCKWVTSHMISCCTSHVTYGWLSSHTAGYCIIANHMWSTIAIYMWRVTYNSQPYVTWSIYNWCDSFICDVQEPTIFDVWHTRVNHMSWLLYVTYGWRLYLCTRILSRESRHI